jgi:hypothetical protein
MAMLAFTQQSHRFGICHPQLTKDFRGLTTTQAGRRHDAEPVGDRGRTLALLEQRGDVAGSPARTT